MIKVTYHLIIAFYWLAPRCYEMRQELIQGNQLTLWSYNVAFEIERHRLNGER